MIRPALTDADLEAWRRVRKAVLPNERAASVDEMRAAATPDTLWLVAEEDGDLVGSGLARSSDFAGIAFLAPRVLPDARRRGHGTGLLRALAGHAVAHGYAEASSVVDDEGSRVFAERFGFRGCWLQVEQVRTIEPGERPPEVPDDIELASLAERPELFRRTFEELAREALADLPLEEPVDVSLESWEREWVSYPEGSFVALAGEEIVGCAGLVRDPDVPERAEHSLTAVRRDQRRRGIASALKQQTIAWASANGLRELYTWTQDCNEAMRSVNERLGYVARTTSIRLHAPLPLTGL